jgi:hypothetical protein
MPAWSSTLGIVCFFLLTQVRPATADQIDGTSLSKGDLVIVIFDSTWPTSRRTLVLTKISDVDGQGVISISGNRTFFMGDVTQKTSLTGTLKAEDVNKAHEISASKVSKLKLTVTETNAAQSPDQQ